MATSDVISVHVHCPMKPGLVSRALFETVKPGAIFINTSREHKADDSGAADGLISGRVQVWTWRANPTGGHPLVRYAQEHDNLLITPIVAVSAPCRPTGMPPRRVHRRASPKDRLVSEIDKLAADYAVAGTTHVFGITGSGASLLLCDRLEKVGLRVIRTQFEGSAGIMAGTVGRLTGKPGVALTIKGPGVANLVPGLAVSSYESFPLVALSDAYPPGSPPSRAHKRLDHATLAAPVTKAVRPLSVKGPGFLDAAALACAEIPGPVLLELTGAVLEDAAPLPVATAPACNQAVIDRVAAARKPVVIAGTLAIRQGWGGPGKAGGAGKHHRSRQGHRRDVIASCQRIHFTDGTNA